MLYRRLAFAVTCACGFAVMFSGMASAALNSVTPALPEKPAIPLMSQTAQCLRLNDEFLKLRQTLQQEVAARHPAYAAGMLKAQTPWQLGIYMAFSNQVALSNYLNSGLPESRITLLLTKDLLLGCTGPKLVIN